tara:strand:+ start:42 stop:674 length:633 start_codon:yes stop_codon:yes gene_type:complete
MANLIIKSSADNLVLQGSDASPAITVGATGTTTFAENATFSGTANVYGAGTFPTGMVLQVASDNYNASLETGGSATKLCEVSLVTKQANSKFFYTSCISVGGEGDADNIYLTVSKTAGTSAVESDDLPTDNLTPSTGTRAGKQYQSDNADINQYGMNSVCLSDLVVSTHAIAANITFGLWAKGGCYINRSWGRANTESGITTLSVMEIGV